jgi:ribosomal protein S18 acetylase RimI-like enzyme
MIFADDTRPETREVLLRLWRAKSEGERALHGFRLWNSVKNRIMSAIISKNPDIDPIELLVETFRCIYRNDFAPAEMERICERIRGYHQAKNKGQATINVQPASPHNNSKTPSFIKIIDYDDKYALDTIRMWRESKEKALGVKDVHSFDEHLSFLRTRLIKENKVLLAIDECTDTVVGIMALAGSELDQLYIHVGYQRMGIGSRLLQMAKELSPGKLQLFTFEVNKNAQAFYEKHGFAIIGRGYENEENLSDIRYEWVKE